MNFHRREDSHAHSLETLDMLYGYDDFMESISTMVDLGCGYGLDLEWWASRTTRDENPIPLNIKCMGVDMLDKLGVAGKYPNINYQRCDFEGKIEPFKDKKFDLLWCHDAFQYVINPLETLKRWRDIANDDAMLVIIVPQTTNVQFKDLDFVQPNGCYYHHTLPSLIHMLAINGWDCRDGFFLKHPSDPWIHAVVYKSTQEPMDPKTTTWYELAERNLLPLSACAGIGRHGYLRQQDLFLPWLDKNSRAYNKQ